MVEIPKGHGFEAHTRHIAFIAQAQQLIRAHIGSQLRALSSDAKQEHCVRRALINRARHAT